MSSFYPEFLRSSNKRQMQCSCNNGHTWYAWFYKTLNERCREIWSWGELNGSTCPECGEQDVKN